MTHDKSQLHGSVDDTFDGGIGDHQAMASGRSGDGQRDGDEDRSGQSSPSISTLPEAQPASPDASTDDAEIVLPIVGPTIAATINTSIKRRSKPAGGSSGDAVRDGPQRRPSRNRSGRTNIPIDWPGGTALPFRPDGVVVTERSPTPVEKPFDVPRIVPAHSFGGLAC